MLNHHPYQSIFSGCRRILGEQTWDRVLAALDKEAGPEYFAETLATVKTTWGLPPYVDDLARVEWLRHRTEIDPARPVDPVLQLMVNPSLSLVPVDWKHLDRLLNADDENNDAPQPEPGAAHVIVWKHPQTNVCHIRQAEDGDLLALKIVVEGIDPRRAAETNEAATVGVIQSAIKTAVARGLLLSPPSRIRREIRPDTDEALTFFNSTDIFTLQWHITQACDLHCRHCYDRSDRTPLPLDLALHILDDFYDFCQAMNVNGQITFTGGNPLLYPHFSTVYQAAAEKGFGVAILGNPTPSERIKELCEIVRPRFFQVSLEGLAEHNDYIRGTGHFQRTLDFLDRLREMDIFTMVMLTLTAANLEQVLPLGALLAGHADFFTFNRLSAVGEGRNLLMPEKDRFASFLKTYEAAVRENNILGLKDNLINIVKKQDGRRLFGGCTGYGCGAAFNFVALLADGEVHACRKFPSPLGNIKTQSLFDIYHQPTAGMYRQGSEACRECNLNPVCRGCLAVTHSCGGDIFKDADPYCFLSR